MKVDRNNAFKKICLGLVLCCLLAPNAFAILVENIRSNELQPIVVGVSKSVSEGTQSIGIKAKDYPSNTFAHHNNFMFVDFIKKNGQLFFEMRDEHGLVSESSTIVLFLLGLIGVFSRRWL